jgi:hypothetical protein
VLNPPEGNSALAVQTAPGDVVADSDPYELVVIAIDNAVGGSVGRGVGTVPSVAGTVTTQKTP